MPAADSRAVAHSPRQRQQLLLESAERLFFIVSFSAISLKMVMQQDR